MKRSLKLSSLALLLVLAAGWSAAGRLTPESVSVHRLDNGLKVLMVEDHDIPNIAYYTFFRVGSRNERPGLTGVSHFIEHMMFNGSGKFGPGEFDRIMEFNGGANNAFTGNDMTGYTDWFPGQAMEKMMDMEADRMQGLLFDPPVFESERGVIASERRMGVENNNQRLLSETLKATAYLAHPYGWGVIGWMSDIQSWKRDEVKQYYQTYYSPNNAVLVVVGDFQREELVSLIERYYGKIPAGPPPPAVATVEPEQLGPRRFTIRKEAQSASLQIAWHMPEAASPEYPALDILSTVLAGGDSSRLHRRLVRDKQLAISVYCIAGENVNPGLFTIGVMPRAGADPDQIEKEIEQELEQIAREGITPRELEKSINSVRVDFYREMQTINGVADLLGRMEMVYGSYDRLFAQVPRYEAVTAGQVRQAAAAFLKPDNKTTGVLIPKGGAR